MFQSIARLASAWILVCAAQPELAAQCAISCHNLVQVSLNQDGQATISLQMILTNAYPLPCLTNSTFNYERFNLQLNFMYAKGQNKPALAQTLEPRQNQPNQWRPETTVGYIFPIGERAVVAS